LDQNQTLGASTTNLPPDIPETTSLPETVTISAPHWQTLSVYQEPSLSSPVAGKITYGQNYQVTSKQSDWYLIKPTPESQGWIKAQFVTPTISQP